MKGHLRERPPGSGNWYAVIDARDPVTGARKRKFHSLEADGRRKAEIECAKLISAIDGGTYSEPSKTTLAQFLDQWLENIRPNVSPRTHERYTEIARKNLVPLLGGAIVSKLTPAQISGAYAKALSEGRRDGKGGLSAQTVRHIHRVLKQALGPIRWERIHRNSEDHIVKPPKVEKRQMKVYDLPQTATLLDAVRDTRMFVPAMLAVLCGLRRGEVAALRWRNVDLSAASLAVVESAEQTDTGIRYKETKSGRARKVALSDTAIEELKAWRVRQAQELLRLGSRPDRETFVVTQTDGSPLQPRSLTHEWVRVLATATKLPRIRFHDLRHAHATHMLGSGVHPKIASERLGHSKIGITLDLYSHVMPGMQDDAVAKLDVALRAAQDKVRR